MYTTQDHARLQGCWNSERTYALDLGQLCYKGFIIHGCNFSITQLTRLEMTSKVQNIPGLYSGTV